MIAQVDFVALAQDVATKQAAHQEAARIAEEYQGHVVATTRRAKAKAALAAEAATALAEAKQALEAAAKAMSQPAQQSAPVGKGK